jgi:hypothetical protein
MKKLIDSMAKQLFDERAAHVKQRDEMQAEIDRLNTVLRALSAEMDAMRTRSMSEEGDNDGG